MNKSDEQAYIFATGEYVAKAKKCCEKCYISACNEITQTAVMHGFKGGYATAKKYSVNTVMDLFYVLKEIGGSPTLKDLVKLAKRIKK